MEAETIEIILACTACTIPWWVWVIYKDRCSRDVVGLVRDAKRYRYMRKTAAFQDRNGPGLYWYLPRWEGGLPAGERLDKAIDAHLKAKS